MLLCGHPRTPIDSAPVLLCGPIKGNSTATFHSAAIPIPQHSAPGPKESKYFNQQNFTMLLNRLFHTLQPWKKANPPAATDTAAIEESRIHWCLCCFANTRKNPRTHCGSMAFQAEIVLPDTTAPLQHKNKSSRGN